MIVPCSGSSRVPRVARMASGSSADAVRAFGRPVRKSAMSSTSEWPTSRNSRGDMSAGDERLLAGRRPLAALATFFFAPFLGAAFFDFGTVVSTSRVRGRQREYHSGWPRSARPSLCNDFRAMNPPNKLIFTIAIAGACLVVGAGCRSAPVTRPRPIQDDPGDRRATHEEEATLIRADSEIFAAVVRAQLDGEDGAYPGHLERLRYDARPYGTDTGYPEVFAGVQGIDPTLTFARAGQDAIDDLIDNRKRILEASAVGVGGPPVYNQCAGAGVPTPPPVRGTPSRTRRSDVHAGCPKQPEYYLTV